MVLAPSDSEAFDVVPGICNVEGFEFFAALTLFNGSKGLSIGHVFPFSFQDLCLPTHAAKDRRCPGYGRF